MHCGAFHWLWGAADEMCIATELRGSLKRKLSEVSEKWGGGSRDGGNMTVTGAQRPELFPFGRAGRTLGFEAVRMNRRHSMV